MVYFFCISKHYLYICIVEINNTTKNKTHTHIYTNMQNENDNKELKSKLEIVIRECFKRASERKFKELNFVFPKNKTEKQFLNIKLKTLNNLDIYSQTFLSIHTRAKIALKEFQNVKFEGAYLELLRLVLTLPESLNKTKMISVRKYEKHEWDLLSIGKNITIKEEEKENKIKPKTKLIKQGIKGKTIKNKQLKTESLIDEILDIDFSDDNDSLKLKQEIENMTI